VVAVSLANPLENFSHQHRALDLEHYFRHALCALRF